MWTTKFLVVIKSLKIFKILNQSEIVHLIKCWWRHDLEIDSWHCVEFMKFSLFMIDFDYFLSRYLYSYCNLYLHYVRQLLPQNNYWVTFNQIWRFLFSWSEAALNILGILAAWIVYKFTDLNCSNLHFSVFLVHNQLDWQIWHITSICRYNYFIFSNEQ